MKKSFYFLVSAILSLVMLSGLFGMITEKRNYRLIKLINSPCLSTAAIVKYRRGWFNSSARIQLSLNDKCPIANKLGHIFINAEVKHGPIIIDWLRFRFAPAKLTAFIDLSPEQNNLLKRNIKNPPLATIKIKFKFDGAVDIIFNLPKFEYSNGDDILGIDGLEVKTTLSQNHCRINSNLECLNLNSVANGHKIDLDKITGHYYGKKIDHQLWLGKYHLQIKSALSKSLWGHSIRLDNFYIANRLMLANDQSINFHLESSLDELSINNAIYYRNNIFELEVTSINKKLLARIDTLLTLKNINFSLNSILLELLFSILNEGSKIKISRAISNTYLGKIALIANMVCNNSSENIGWISTLTNSRLDLNLKVEKALMLYLSDKIYKNNPTSTGNNFYSPGISRKLLEELAAANSSNNLDGNILDLAVSYRDNQVFINEKPLTISIQ